jgi:hypothetical protein
MCAFLMNFLIYSDLKYSIEIFDKIPFEKEKMNFKGHSCNKVMN